MRRLTGVMGEPIEDAVARVQVDLTPPATDMREVIRDSLAPEHAERATAALESLRPLGTTATARGVKAEIGMRVPSGPPPLVGPEPALTDEERHRWEEALANWDAFLTFAVKALGLTDSDPAAIDALFRLFVDGRHAVLAVLTAGPQHGEDPVRLLFLATWSQMRTIVRRRDALLYLRFLAAGDALAALERVGPDVGIEISADGLRRLARTLDPDTLFDPRARSDAPDPELRRLFGFHEPPATPLPPEPPPSPTPAAPPPQSWWWSLGGVAHAAEPPHPVELAAIGSKLDRFVPGPEQMDEYRTVVSRLLDLVAASEREDRRIPAAMQTLFRQLVRTTAWQESCWHQYARRGEQIVVLVSRTGDVGLMQVNRRVWRGVFDAAALERDVVYNADAGTQILAQYLTRYGQREGRVAGGHVARSTYAAYNGGPGAYTRYRTGRRATGYTRKVDTAFWKKFQIAAAGRELGHVPCPPEVH
jgi:soluble lytic murein transglycosylase-like protein